MNQPPSRYDQRNIETMEAVYGEGFLSPGGPKEVARIVAGLDVAGCRVLDLGCGLGGGAIALAQHHGPEHVTGADIDATVLERAQQLVTAGDLDQRVTLQRIDPGPLPFDADRFDIVYANSVTCHIEALEPFLAEVFRVLAPGGSFIGAEWYVVDHQSGAFKQWDDLLRARGLAFHFVTRSRFTDAITTCRFAAPVYTDRSTAISALSVEALEQVRGPLRERLTSALGEEGYAALERWAEARRAVFDGDGMRHCHFRADKP